MKCIASVFIVLALLVLAAPVFAAAPLEGMKSTMGACTGPGLISLSGVKWDGTGTNKLYRVFIENQWVYVPPATVVKGSGPSAVAYTMSGGKPVISCFKPG